MTTRSSQVIGDKFVLGAEVERWYQAHAGEHNWLQKFVEQKFPRAVPVKLRGDRDAWNKLRTLCSKARTLHKSTVEKESLQGGLGRGFRRACVAQVRSNCRRKAVGGGRPFKLPELREALYDWFVNTIVNLKVRFH
jgi:hypothetical protein